MLSIIVERRAKRKLFIPKRANNITSLPAFIHYTCLTRTLSLSLLLLLLFCFLSFLLFVLLFILLFIYRRSPPSSFFYYYLLRNGGKYLEISNFKRARWRSRKREDAQDDVIARRILTKASIFPRGCRYPNFRLQTRCFPRLENGKCERVIPRDERRVVYRCPACCILSLVATVSSSTSFDVNRTICATLLWNRMRRVHMGARSMNRHRELIILNECQFPGAIA